MNNKPKDSNNFWSGFALGALGGGALLYFFATNRGRKTIKSLLQSSESIEHDIEGLFEILQQNNIFVTPDKEEEKK